MTRIASRTARACLGTAQHLFFWCFRPARNWAPGQAYWNEDGIISGHTSPISQIISGHTSPFCRRSTDLVLICGKSHAVLRGTSSDYGSWSNWAYYSLDSRGLCLGHSVLPLPCENRRLSIGFCRDIILFFQFKHTDGLYESQYRRVFYSYYCRSEWLGIFLSWEYKEPSMQPTKAPLCSSLQQNVQPFLTQQSSSTY